MLDRGVSFEGRGNLTQGAITKLVTSYGSRWGRIQPEGESREIFFNVKALDGSDFLALLVGEIVEYEEHVDFVNGSHAEHVVSVIKPAVKNRDG